MRKILVIILSVLCLLSLTFSVACTNKNNKQEVKNCEFNLVTNEISLDVGGSSKIGVLYDGNEEIKYSSSNTQVASVDSQGNVLGISEGLAFISVQIGSNVSSVKVVVKEIIYTVSLDHTSIIIPKGSTYKFSSKPLKNGEYYADDITWQVLNKDGNLALTNDYGIEIEGNLATYIAKETGDYVIKVSSSNASKSCNIKVVTTDARVLETPVLNVVNCKKINWNAVDNATFYNVKVGANDWEQVNDTQFDLSSYVSGNLLKDGEVLKVDVKAIAEGKYDYLDSYIGSVKISHEYVSTVKQAGTCVIAGIKEYTCNLCENVYEDEYFAHDYVQGFCKNCKDAYTNTVTYGYDDNFIPMPSPEDAENSESEWRKKYGKYVKQYQTKITDLLEYEGDGVNFERKECYLKIGGNLKTFALKKSYNEGWTDSKTYYEVLWHLVNENKDNIPLEERQECYYVSGVSDGRATEIYLSGYYDDGRHGYHEVKYVKQKAFMNNNILTKVEFAENISEMRGSCFYSCFTVKTVIAPGIKFLPQSTDYMKGYYHDNFTNAYGMRELVLGDGVYIDGRNFHPYNKGDKYEHRLLDIYVNGSNNASMAYFWEIQPSYWDIFSGNYYYRDDRDGGYECNTWTYSESGDIMINHHDYSSNGVNFVCKNCGQKLKCGEKYYDYNGNVVSREHDFDEISGKCVYCGSLNPKGLIFKYDAENDGYSVVGYEYVSTVLTIPSQFNDGENGLKNVISVGAKVFKGNKTITHVILPSTVTYIGGSAFESMPNLTFVDMGGVKELPFDDFKNVNHFVDDFKLETVIIQKDFNIQTQCFIDNPVDGKQCVGFTIYAREPSGDINFINKPGKGINNMWNGKVLYYDENLEKCGSWNFKGLKIQLNEQTPIDENGDGYCDHESCKGVVVDKTKAITYVYNEETQTYFVSQNKDLTLSEVVIPDKFNDGVHGEKNVTEIGKSAFEYNNYVERIVLSENITSLKDSAFSSMSNLKFISMTGVSELTDKSQTNQFVDDTNLESVIIKKDLKVSVQAFFDRQDQESEFTIYALEPNGTIDIDQSKNNNMWNKGLYFFDETESLSRCYSWCYDEDGKTVKVSTSTPVDENRDGYCDHENCKGLIVDITKAVTYEYDENSNSYFVTRNSVLVPETDENEYVVCIVSSTFNDGTHGELPVTKISTSAFERNSKITHIVLPESITELGQFAFAGMAKLQTVIMTGVKEIKTKDVDKQFHGSPLIRKIVIGQDFDVSQMSLNLDSKPNHTTAYKNLITLYSTTIGGSVQVNNWDGRNDGFSGNLIYCWHYENVYEPKEDSEHKHEYLDEKGKCLYCNNFVEKTTLATYGFNEETNSYEIIGDDKMTFLGGSGDGKDYNGKSISTVIKIPTLYNDGIHGDAPVTAVNAQAFESNHKLTAIVLPKSVTVIHKLAFNDCQSLKTVQMTGVTSLTDKDDDWQFRSCGALRTVIVGQNFNATRRCLKIDENANDYNANSPKPFDNKITLYSTTIGGNIWLTHDYQSRNSSWNGEICYCWEWADENEIEPVKLSSHKYVDDGECEYCNHVYHAKGNPHYRWDETTNSYYVSGDGMTFENDEEGRQVPTDIVIPSWYNDGTHGDARVTRVAPGALNTNLKVTSIVLPSTVTVLGQMCFANMTALKTVVIKGNLYLTSETSGSGKIFEGSTSLTNLVLSSNVYVADGVYFVRKSGSPSGTVNVYVAGDSGEEVGTARGDGKRNVYLPYSYNYDKNESFGGKINYYYRKTLEEYNGLDETQKINAWCYGADGKTPIRWKEYISA